MPLALADYPDSGHNVIWTLTLIAKAASAEVETDSATQGAQGLIGMSKGPKVMWAAGLGWTGLD